MRQVEDAGAIGDAVLQLARAHNVLLVIGAGAGNVARLSPQHPRNGTGCGIHHGRVFGRGGGHKTHDVANAVIKARPRALELVEHVDDFLLDGFQVLFGDEPAVQHRAATVRHHRCGRLRRGPATRIVGVVLLHLAAVDAVDVEGAHACARRLHRFGCVAALQAGLQLRLQQMDEGAHVVDGTVAQKRHGAMRDAAPRLHLAPPHTPVPQANTVHPQRLGNDHMVHTRFAEVTALGQIAHARKAARFFVHGAADLQCSGNRQARLDQGFAGDDAGRQTTFHVAAASAIHAPVGHLPAKWLIGPARSGLNHVDVAVEMHALARRLPLPARHHIGARVAVAVARRADGPNIFHRKAFFGQPFADEMGTRFISVTRRVDGGNAHQVLREGGHLFAFGFDAVQQLLNR